MKRRIFKIMVCLVAVLSGAAVAGNPSWSARDNNGTAHAFFTTPPASSSDNAYTAVWIGYPSSNMAAACMLNVSSYKTVQNAIRGIADAAGSIGVTGFNNNGIGVQGHSYYNHGVYGLSGDGVANRGGAGGYFRNATSTGTALLTDNGVVKFSTSASTDPVLTVTYTGTDAFDHIAVRGISQPQPFYGYGGYFSGGYMGVRGESTLGGAGTRTGGYFVATGGATANRGIEATAWSNSGDNWAGYFNGRVYSTGGYQPSDEKLKKEVAELDGSLDKVMKLKPVSYHYKTDEYAKLALPQEKQNGLIAQDVETVFPEIVCETAILPEKNDAAVYQSKEPEKIKAVNYTALIPVLTKAIQEQQKMILELKKEIQVLKNFR
jgi:hypothetical protein